MWVSERLKCTALSLSNVEKWRKTLDAGGETGALFTDLSKAFDCIDHNLLVAKLNAYGFDKQSMNFIYSYFTKRKQRTKVDSAVSSRELLFSGVPQGSVLGPLSFNIYISVTCFMKHQQILTSLDMQMTILLRHTLQI